MNKSHLMLGVLAVAVVIGIAAYRSSGTLVSEDNAAAVATAVAPSALVVYTNEGFVPKTLTVARGTTIRFFNASASGALRISPRVDSSGSSNRDLSSSQSVKLGQSFYASVTMTGTWTYENLNKPSISGVVVVTE